MFESDCEWKDRIQPIVPHASQTLKVVHYLRIDSPNGTSNGLSETSGVSMLLQSKKTITYRLRKFVLHDQDCSPICKRKYSTSILCLDPNNLYYLYKDFHIHQMTSACFQMRSYEYKLSSTNMRSTRQARWEVYKKIGHRRQATRNKNQQPDNLSRYYMCFGNIQHFQNALI